MVCHIICGIVLSPLGGNFVVFLDLVWFSRLERELILDWTRVMAEVRLTSARIMSSSFVAFVAFVVDDELP